MRCATSPLWTQTSTSIHTNTRVNLFFVVSAIINGGLGTTRQSDGVHGWFHPTENHCCNVSWIPSPPLSISKQVPVRQHHLTHFPNRQLEYISNMLGCRSWGIHLWTLFTHYMFVSGCHHACYVILLAKHSNYVWKQGTGFGNVADMKHIMSTKIVVS